MLRVRSHGLERVADVLAIGVELRGKLKLDERLVQPAPALEPSASGKMVGGGSHAGAVE
jgi:hypothetical protein